jgi:flavin reductase (DIM6/NTAB) family NADH-FMN oxidoreductase RutF
LPFLFIKRLTTALPFVYAANINIGEIAMNKIPVGPQLYIYPQPTFLVGANIDTKPNFMAVAWGGIANSEPPMLSVAIRHHRHTYLGIKQNMTFSVNIASIDMVKETDYCGIVSGSQVDKSAACHFKIFYGKLKTAPLIEQCPVNLECKVIHLLNLGTHTLVIGQIEETYVSEECLSDGKPDMSRIMPIIADIPARSYHRPGDFIGKAFSIGKEIR